jgi:muramidase (phage lysozyme)
MIKERDKDILAEININLSRIANALEHISNTWALANEDFTFMDAVKIWRDQK